MSTEDSQSQPLGYDFNGDIPRPDGFVNPTDEEEWKKPSGQTVQVGYGIDGFSGYSEVAARSDHVHPCNISSLNPELVGLPGFLYINEYFTQNWDSIIKGYGRYGRAGIPLPTDTHKSNMYALSNHVHEYGFISDVKHRTGSFASNPLYQTCLDGAFLKYGISYSSHNDRGRADLLLDEWPDTNESTQKLGYFGKIPLPAHVDHVHPLNCRELHDSSATGNSVKDYVKPIGFDPSKSTSGYGASYGTDGYYARTDHVHPLPTNGTGATGIGSDNTFYATRYSQNNRLVPTAYFNVNSTDSSKFNYGSDSYSQTWERDSTSNNKGFTINVCCGVGNFGNTSTVGLVFRKLTFDKYGLCREVGTPVAIKLN